MVSKRFAENAEKTVLVDTDMIVMTQGGINPDVNAKPETVLAKALPAVKVLGNISGAQSLDLSENGDVSAQVTANVTFTINPNRTRVGVWHLILSDVAGGHAITWFPLVGFPMWNQAANNLQVFQFYYDGTNHYLMSQA